MAKRADRKKHHVLYKTTCLTTGRYYIGMHSTDNLDDDYIGSGKRLWYSINKHCRENHVREVIELCETREALRKREAELVNPEVMKDPMCMNLKLGGEGGWDHITSEMKRSAAIATNKKLWANPEFRKRATSRMAIVSTFKKYGPLSDSHKENIRRPQLNSKWVYKEEVRKRVSADLVQNFLDLGWTIGRGKVAYRKSQSEETKQKIRNSRNLAVR